jgi:hypothetical protein
MGKVYDLGFRMAEAGYPWKKVPPRMAGHRLPNRGKIAVALGR